MRGVSLDHGAQRLPHSLSLPLVVLDIVSAAVEGSCDFAPDDEHEAANLHHPLVELVQFVDRKAMALLALVFISIGCLPTEESGTLTHS